MLAGSGERHAGAVVPLASVRLVQLRPSPALAKALRGAPARVSAFAADIGFRALKRCSHRDRRGHPSPRESALLLPTRSRRSFAFYAGPPPTAAGGRYGRLAGKSLRQLLFCMINGFRGFPRIS